MDPLLDCAPFGFLVARDDGYIELANRTMADLLDRPRDQVVGHHLDGCLSPPSRIFYQSHFFPILKLQGRVHEVYVSLVARDGTEVPVLLNANRRETPDGPRNDWAVVPMRTRNEYENEIIAARRQAEAASAAKDALLSFVSHELRSPLSAILNWSNLLGREEVDATKLKRGIDAIERNARLQLKLVDDMLDFARLAAGKFKVDLAPIDARPVLEMVMESLQPAANAKGVALSSLIDAGSTRVSADAERLQQVFWNVLNNALKFTPKDGRVSVVMRREDGWIEVEVTDTGKGIAPEFLPHVFDSFRQEQGRIQRDEGGLGLGMSITRQLVELHGGSVSASSLGPGCGATFKVRLPALAYSNGSHPARQL